MKKVTTTIALLLCILAVSAYSQTNGSISARALILTDDKGHSVRLIPQQNAEPGDYIYEIPLLKKRGTGIPIGIEMNSEENVLGSSSGILGSQNPQANLDNEPFITFGNGTTNMTNNRVATAGNGISLSTAAGDNGAFTITNSGVLSLTGTSNQVTVSGSTGSVTLSLPQSINNNATPIFDGLTLDNLNQSSTQTRMVVSTSGGQIQSRTLASLGLADGDEPFVTFGNGSSGLTNNRVLNDGVGINITIEAGDNSDFLIENDGVLTVTGTTNQVSVSASKGNVTFSLPQNIHNNAVPTFNSVNLDNMVQNSTQTRLVVSNAGTLESRTLASLNLADDSEPFLTFAAASSNLSNNRVINAGTGIGINIAGADNGNVTFSNTGVLSLAGTANQVNINNSTGNITLSLPQNIHNNATPTFDGLTLDNMTANSTQTRLVVATAGGTLQTRTLASVSLIDAAEPIITFGTDNGSLSNNRLFTAGSGLGVGISAGDNGAFTVSNTGVLSNVAGSGISVSGATGNVTIANTGVLSTTAGSGIGVSGANGNVTISNNGLLSAAAGNGVSVATTAGNAVITNTGVLSNAAGSGISVSGPTGNVTIANTGVLSTIAGSGIGVSGANGNVTISNNGLLSASAGNGVSVATTAGNAVITNTGLLSAVGGSGIGVSVTDGVLTITNQGIEAVDCGTGLSMSLSGTTITLANTGVLSATASAGITLDNSTGNITIGNSGVLSTIAGAGIGLSGANGDVTITNNGVLSNIAGTGILISSANGDVTISNNGLLSASAGSGIDISIAAGNAQVTNTGVLSVIAGTGIAIDNSTGNSTISNTGVLSVGLAMPDIFAVANSPVTTTGTFDVTLAEQAEHAFLAGPISGAGVPSFRTIDYSDLEPIVWTLHGNNVAAGAYIGTTNTESFDMRVNNTTRFILTDRISVQRDNNDDVRGYYATDMQAERDAADQVASGNHSTISGGRNNRASAIGATIAGGGTDGYSVDGNIASARGTAIGGGKGNQASTDLSTIGGGDFNTASGFVSSIIGGQFNIAGDYGSTVAGGISNTSGGELTFVGGGAENTASGVRAVVGGGQGNTATAEYSNVLGGQGNSASANFASIAGGNANIASGQGSFIGGGGWDGHSTTGNTASGTASSVVGGTGNIASGSRATAMGGGVGASGDYSVAMGGFGNASGNYSFSSGFNALATKHGQATHASGSFATIGDAQRSEMVARNTTADSTWVELFLDGSSLVMTVASNTAWTYSIHIIGISSTGDVGSYEIKGAIKNIAGTTSLVGSATVTTIAEDLALWDVRITADDTSDKLMLEVLGDDGTDIRWVASVRTTEVTY